MSSDHRHTGLAAIRFLAQFHRESQLRPRPAGLPFNRRRHGSDSGRSAVHIEGLGIGIGFDHCLSQPHFFPGQVTPSEGGVAIGYVQATVLPDAAALVAYEFNSAWWGRGLANEAVAAAMRELRQHLGVTRFGAVFKTANERSRRLLARLGMCPALGGQFPSALVEAGESAMAMGL